MGGGPFKSKIQFRPDNPSQGLSPLPCRPVTEFVRHRALYFFPTFIFLVFVINSPLNERLFCNSFALQDSVMVEKAPRLPATAFLLAWFFLKLAKSAFRLISHYKVLELFPGMCGSSPCPLSRSLARGFLS